MQYSFIGMVSLLSLEWSHCLLNWNDLDELHIDKVHRLFFFGKKVHILFLCGGDNNHCNDCNEAMIAIAIPSIHCNHCYPLKKKKKKYMHFAYM